MNQYRTILSFLFCLAAHVFHAQGDFRLVDGFVEPSSKCQSCAESFMKKPPEVQFGFQLNEDGDLFFICTNANWFHSVFKKSSDGIAVDLVHESRFPCGAENDLARSDVRIGELLPPVYYKDFKKILMEIEGGIVFKVGHLSAEARATPYDLNLLVLKGKSVCYYQHFYNLESTRWELLDTGLYMDTIGGITPESSIKEIPKETNVTLGKRMKFEFPFQKGKSTYSSEDIQPLYDSLRLTDFHIIKAEIRAYSSVEGSKERNIELQQKRAESILTALNTFQDRKIEAKITCAENWVEFITDMERSGRTDLAALSQEEIKKRLAKPALSKDLEPYLNKHRKAVLILELQKKTKFNEMDNATVLSLFEESLLEKNVSKAMQIQQELFSRVDDLKLSAEVLTEMKIPKEVEFGGLLNNQSVFDYQSNPENVLEALLGFKELEYLLPDDAHVKYNICVMEIKAWVVGQSTVDPDLLLHDIGRLTSRGIDRKAVDKLKVNFHIVASEYHMRNQNYEAKNESLNFIYKKYRSLGLSDPDLLSLSKYFSSYARFDWALSVLKSKVVKPEVSEDLLFYYVNLTIFDTKLIKKSSYRSALVHASSMNKERFCALFGAYSENGIGLHLRQNNRLKEIYCELCQP